MFSITKHINIYSVIISYNIGPCDVAVGSLVCGCHRPLASPINTFLVSDQSFMF